MDRTQIQNQIKSNKPHKRLPEWAKRPLGRPSVLHELKSTLRKRGLSTVCESARCPNIGECFSKPTATFMILGSVCTRKCTFCNVTKNEQAQKTDSNEPENIALTSFEMGLKHVVVTSVTRDDLSDGGASHFASTIKALRDKISGISVEVLTPDFNGVKSSLEKVFLARPNIFNHNVETIKRLYPRVRPEADYDRSLDVLRSAKEFGLTVKSGIMVGLGETKAEVIETLKDLKDAGCDIVTIGQYLRPKRENLEVVDYIEPEVFKEYEEEGLKLGLKQVFAGTFVRSSYNADKVFEDYEKNNI